MRQMPAFRRNAYNDRPIDGKVVISVVRVCYDRIMQFLAGKGEMAWQPTENGLGHLVLIRPVNNTLPPRDEIEGFFDRMQNLAGNQDKWGKISKLQLDINARGRWLSANFKFEFADWSFLVQIISPDAVVSPGSIEFVPRVVRGRAIGGEIDANAIRRTWNALQAAIREIALRAGEDSELADHLPLPPSV